jgi:hypothetical protein
VLQCLAQDIAGGPVADETGGALGQAGWYCGWCPIPFVIRFNNRKGVGLLLSVRWWLDCFCDGIGRMSWTGL